MSQEKIFVIKQLVEMVKDMVLVPDHIWKVTDENKILAEIMTLYARQVNLLESAMLLIENGHAEEAYLLYRSMLTNTMTITYLCHGDDSRFQSYLGQPKWSLLK